MSRRVPERGGEGEEDSGGGVGSGREGAKCERRRMVRE